LPPVARRRRAATPPPARRREWRRWSTRWRLSRPPPPEAMSPLRIRKRPVPGRTSIHAACEGLSPASGQPPELSPPDLPHAQPARRVGGHINPHGKQVDSLFGLELACLKDADSDRRLFATGDVVKKRLLAVGGAHRSGAHREEFTDRHLPAGVLRGHARPHGI